MTTSAKEWKAKRGSEVMLPSGNTATLRRISLLRMVSSGSEVPDLLSGLVAGAMDGADASSLIKPEALPGLSKVLDIVCRAAFVEPVIAADGVAPEDDEIELGDLTDPDRIFVMSYVMGRVGGDAVAAFPVQSQNDLDAVPTDDDATRGVVTPSWDQQ